MLDFMVILHRHHLAEEPGSLWIKDHCLQFTSRITEVINDLAQTAVLPYLQDTASYMTSSTAVLLDKVSHLRPS